MFKQTQFTFYGAAFFLLPFYTDKVGDQNDFRKTDRYRGERTENEKKKFVLKREKMAYVGVSVIKCY